MTGQYPSFYTFPAPKYTGAGFTKWTSSAVIGRAKSRYDGAQKVLQKRHHIGEIAYGHHQVWLIGTW